jgi:zinc transporter ZupT
MVIRDMLEFVRATFGRKSLLCWYEKVMFIPIAMLTMCVIAVGAVIDCFFFYHSKPTHVDVPPTDETEDYIPPST